MAVSNEKTSQISLRDDIFVDVFISYSRKDEPIAKKFYELLITEGYAVWYDEKIYGGADWEENLMTYLTNAKAIVVLWTENSIISPWVIKEATIAFRSNRLIPVVLDNISYPSEFQSLQYVLLKGWGGEKNHAKLEQLFKGISRLAPPSRIDNVRPGFVTDFLGVDTELPSITGVADEFRYLHFSVVMNPARRLPWYVAYNLEPSNSAVIRSDKWMPDPILPASFQPGNEHYLGTGFDRGHIISPATISWGKRKEAQLANRQSFFWTNTAPQHPEMNRGWWWDIENWERKLMLICKKAVGFAGPVLKNDDPLLKNVEQIVGRLKVKQNFRLPSAFWKIVLIKEGSELLYAAFLLNQDELLMNKTPRTSNVSKYSCSIFDIENATGLEFCQIIHKAIPLNLDNLPI